MIATLDPMPVSEDPATQAALLRILVDKLPAMLAYWDASLRCRFANRAYEKWFGVDPATMIGRDMKEFLGPLFVLNRPYVEGALRGEEQQFEREIPDPKGGPPRYSQAHYVPDVVDGEVRGFCVLVADITQRKKAEDSLRLVERQLQAKDRLAALATLAAGIAHEINNPLASVLGNVQLALESLDSGVTDAASLRASLSAAREGAGRIREIVQSMKLLARGDATKQAPVDVVETLTHAIDLASNAFRYRARLVTDFEGGGYVRGDAAPLAQVFVALLVNAAEAIPDGMPEPGEIRVTTRREGQTIVVEVADNGCGIPDDLQASVFEPFFTTKHKEGSLGLGLAVSNGIVAGFGGTLTLTSKVGEGSVFRVTLPAVEPPSVAPPPSAQSETRVRPAQPAARAKTAARPRILIVDDEPALVKTLALVLGNEYEVVTATRGADAVALLTEPVPRFDAIVCDLMMPEVSGEDVFRQATRAHPALASRFIFMTGGAFTPRGRRFLESTHVPVLDKPFDIPHVRALVATHVAAAAEADETA